MSPNFARALPLLAVLAAGCTERTSPATDAGLNPDVAALDELRRAGIDLTAPQAVVHHVLFPTTEGAERAAKGAHLKGFEINLVHEPRLRAGKPFLLIVRKPVVPTLENLRATRAELEALATPEGGEYDGWQVHLK